MGMSAKRRALGRGLGALIPTSPDGNGSSSPMDVFFKGNTATRPNDSPPVSRETTDGSDLGTGSNAATATAVLDLAPVPGARYAELPVLSIRPNPKQPRKAFGDDEMAELVHSISEIGILQPVVVRPIPSDELVNMAGQSPDGVAQPHFELIMGERRWRATQAAGLAVIPAIIKDTHDDDLLRDALLENLHRSELNALEEAAAYPGGQLVVGATEVVQQLLIGRCLLQVVELTAVQVLQECVTKKIIVIGVLDDGWNGRQSGSLSRSPTTFTHDELKQRLFDPVRVVTCSVGQFLGPNGPPHHRPNNADLTDRVDQLGHLIIAKSLAWLLGIRTDGEHRELRVTRSGNWRQVHQRRGSDAVRSILPSRLITACFT